MAAAPESERTAIVVAPTRAALRVLRPLAAPAEMLKAQNETRAFVKAVLEEGRDFGKIPGTQEPTLLKPGAEKVTLAFGCSAVPKIIEREIEHDRAVPWQKQKKKWNNGYKGDKSFLWEKEEGQSLGLYRYVVQVDIVDEHGQVRGSGIGSCSTMESKYVDRPRDCENTVLKMAMKRAHVAAVLSTFGLSEEFAQDLEEAHVAAATAVVEEAQASVSPLDKTWPNWPNYKWAGKKFREIPTDELAEQLRKARGAVARARDKKDERIVEMGEALIATIEFVLEDRRDHPEHAPEEKRFEEEPAGAAAASVTATAATPAAGFETRSAALDEDEDDGLPF